MPDSAPAAFDPALVAERHLLDSPAAGRLALYTAQGPAAAAQPAAGAGAGAVPPPLLVVHSVNAAASVAEVRPVFEGERTRRTVVALDLPGFGRSSRERRDYSPRLMTDAVHAAGRWARERLGVPRLDVLALSLSCEFAARAAVEEPAVWRRLALVSPTGFNGTRRRRGPPGSVLGPPALKRVLTWEPLGAPLFRALTRPGVVRYFLRRTYGAHDIDEQLWRDAVATARERGAERAPLHFLSAALFSADINDVYERLEQPVWMSHGTRGDFTDYRGRDTVAGRPNWRFSVFETGAMPYFEQPAAFLEELRAFLDAP